jgi:hypothetical protein
VAVFIFNTTKSASENARTENLKIWLHQLIAKRRVREYFKSKRNVSGTDNPRTISFPIKEHIQESIMEYEVSEDSFVEIIPKPVFCVFPN